VRRAESGDCYCLNSHDKTILASDKAIMHYILINAGIHTPYTIILPSYDDQPVLYKPDLSPLQSNFIIKPANRGGGDGVVMAANTMDEIIKARQDYPHDRYLLQAHIDPVALNGHPAWFRVIYCTGRIYPCWWHPHTHIYTPVTQQEEEQFSLQPIKSITGQIASLTNLDFFSTEIALTEDGRFIVIDYVNDEIDMRLKSRALDGAPDEIIADIAERISTLVAGY